MIAFKAVISLELKRRENDDKIMFLLVKIQELMEVLVQCVVCFGFITQISYNLPQDYVLLLQERTIMMEISQ